MLRERKKKNANKGRQKNLLEGWAVIRVSKENLAQNGSPTQQLNLIKDWEKRQSERSGKTYKVVNYIVEDGKSARYQNTHKRKEILHLAELVKIGAIDFIVSERLDRFSRDEVFNLQIMRDARKNNIELHEVNYGRFNPNDRGQRMGWKFRNLQAGEYSEGVSEDVARKHRSAMIYNGKDPTPRPTLGLDLSDKWIGIYEPNNDELEVVKDILQTFVKLNYSKSGLVKYCRHEDRQYKTKIWWTKEKSKDGEIIKPQKKGDKLFDWETLRTLLESSKLRGYNYFYDNWNQFPDKQDEEGWIRWEYAHHKKHGNLIDPKLWEQVDKGLEQLETRSRANEFLFSGILFAPDGSKYGGEMAKSGEHAYYYNRKINKRFPVEHVHKIVFSRLKDLLGESDLFRQMVEKIQENSDTNSCQFEHSRREIHKNIERLEHIIANFSEALRNIVTESQGNLTEVIDTMLKEKEQASKEITELNLKLAQLDGQESYFKESLKGKDFKEMLSHILRNLHKMHPLEQKKFIQTIIPRATIILGKKKNTIELIYNLDPQKSGRASTGARLPSNVIYLESSKKFQENQKNNKKGQILTSDLAAGGKSWPFVVNGGA